MNPVEQHYDEQTQYEWERFERHRMEFAITGRALKDYLPSPPAKILDIGGGPGRYALALAKKGYDVTLFDLSKNNLQMAQTKALKAGISLSGFIHGNVLDLPTLIQEKFDAVLLLGPLYHLLEEAERETAVAHANAVLKPDGIIFAAVITRYAPFRDQIRKGNLDWVIKKAAHVEDLLQTGKNPDNPTNPFPDSYFAHPNEVRPLLENAGFKTLQILATEGVVSGHEQHINQAEGEIWEKWVALNYQMAHDPVLFGAADHMLYIGQKEGTL